MWNLVLKLITQQFPDFAFKLHLGEERKQKGDAKRERERDRERER